MAQAFDLNQRGPRRHRGQQWGLSSQVFHQTIFADQHTVTGVTPRSAAAHCRRVGPASKMILVPTGKDGEGMSEGRTTWDGRRSWKIAWNAWVVLSVLLILSPSFAASKPKALPKPTNEDCLACHGDSGLSTERDGKSVSLFVNPDNFKNSIHGSMFTCVDCHTDFKVSPHDGQPRRKSIAPLATPTSRPLTIVAITQKPFRPAMATPQNVSTATEVRTRFSRRAIRSPG